MLHRRISYAFIDDMSRVKVRQEVVFVGEVNDPIHAGLSPTGRTSRKPRHTHCHAVHKTCLFLAPLVAVRSNLHPPQTVNDLGVWTTETLRSDDEFAKMSHRHLVRHGNPRVKLFFWHRI